MVDALEVLHDILQSGLTWSSGVAIILAILKLRDSSHSRKVRAQTARDIAQIKEKLGICDLPQSTSRTQIMSYTRNYINYLRAVRQSENPRRKKLMSINKAILAPLLAAIALFLKEAFGFELTVEWQDNIGTLAIIVVAGVGIFMRFFKKKNPPVVIDDTPTFDDMGE